MRINIHRTSGIAPHKGFDWCAVTDSYEPGDANYLQAYGETAMTALYNLLAEIEEPCEVEFIVEGCQYFMNHGGNQ